MEFVISCLRTLFFTLDTIVFGLIDDVYALLMQISRTTIFDQDALHGFSQRVYVMLGLFMLLKVMISIVNYILNPDDLVDKEKGFANIIKRIILSLVMIVLVPYVFREAYELQAIVLSENTIMSIVFGSPGENYRTESNTARSNSSFYDTAGRKIQFTIMYAFAQPNYEEFTGNDIDLTDCREAYKKDKNGNFVFRDKDTVGSKTKGKSHYIYELNESCFGSYNANDDSYSDDGQLLRLINEKVNGDDKDIAVKYYQNYAQGVAQQNFSLFFRKPIILAKTDEGKYAINYKWGVSTAIGVATVYLLLIFCIDIAGRSIKLGFLQLISPIPILSYCDPKSSKDGMFKKWYTMCFKAYAELFIKLFALYFGIYIISLVGTFKDVMTGEAIDNWLVSIFMIIGVLIFVKKLPEIIKDALGVDLGGKLELNPLKKLENDVAGGKLIAGAGKKGLGLASGVAAGTAAEAAGLLTGKGLHRKTFTNALMGGIKGDKFGKNFASSYGAGRERHKELQQMDADGVHRRDLVGPKISNAFGRESKADKIKRASDRYKAIQDTYKSYEGVAAGVDAIAKDIDKRRKAAEAAGDYAAAKRWNTAFDERVKQIAANGGKTATEMTNVDMEKSFDTATGKFNGYKDSTGAATSFGESTDANAALVNYADTMKKLAESLNDTAVKREKIAGATTITIDQDPSGNLTDIKSIKNSAQANQQSIDSNAQNIKAQDISKYVGNNGKK